MFLPPLLLLWLPAPPAPAGFVLKAADNAIRFPSYDVNMPSYETGLIRDQVVVIGRIEWVQRQNESRKGKKKRAQDDAFPDIPENHWAFESRTVNGPGGSFGFSDNGEWGGGITWTDRTGHTSKVSQDNTSILVDTGSGVYGLQGLNHLMFWYGRLIKLEWHGNRWTSKTVTDLHIAPACPVWDGAKFFYVGDRFVSSLELDGSQHEIFRDELSRIQVDTMVRRSNGELWLGCGGGVLCLAPTSGATYHAYWYVKARPKHR